MILADTARLADWILRDLGRELRVARLTAGMTQAEVGRLIGISRSQVSRAEHGLVRSFGVRNLTRHAASLGLKPWIRVFPNRSRPLDSAQLALFRRFRERIGDAWQIRLEVQMPIAGDLRAADALLTIAGCRCQVEVITRLADVQAQLRAAHLKMRDLGADRLILVVAGNTTNRRTIKLARAAVRDALPLDTRTALARLAAGVDPGADALVVL